MFPLVVAALVESQRVGFWISDVLTGTWEHLAQQVTQSSKRFQQTQSKGGTPAA
jgi:hypothetical protein